MLRLPPNSRPVSAWVHTCAKFEAIAEVAQEAKRASARCAQVLTSHRRITLPTNRIHPHGAITWQRLRQTEAKRGRARGPGWCGCRRPSSRSRQSPGSGAVTPRQLPLSARKTVVRADVRRGTHRQVADESRGPGSWHHSVGSVDHCGGLDLYEEFGFGECCDTNARERRQWRSNS